jgi:hypothetical protein
LNCKCGKPFVEYFGEGQTLVGYYSPPGHDHDDNCRTRVYACEDGHKTPLTKQARCPKCDWVGKLTCFCHEGEKIKEWPDAPCASRERSLANW